MSGVHPSPSETMLSSRRTGSTSRYRHSVGTREKRVCFVMNLAIRARSYLTSNGFAHSVQTLWSWRAGN
jgi:hypothetical protein